MLHNCEAGEKAVITGFAHNYVDKGIAGFVYYNNRIQASGVHYWHEKINLPVFRGHVIE